MLVGGRVRPTGATQALPSIAAVGCTYLPTYLPT
jgi:hypothetical protein